MTVEPTPSMTAPPAAADDRWFREEVHAHDAQLKSYLRSSFPTVPDVDDVVQESYLRVWRATAATPIRSARSFLFTVARNLAIGWLRQAKISPINPVADLEALEVKEDKPDASESLSLQEKVELAAEALMTLPPKCREAVMLRKIKGLSQKETAEALGISVKTVDKHLAKGLGLLAVQLKRRGINDLFER
jgi:RNA polymerase sigma factor (sigma-70 family)